MKAMKLTLPILALLALAFVLSGCPKKDKMMGDNMKAPTSQTQAIG
jgi:hypothetical protein